MNLQTLSSVSKLFHYEFLEFSEILSEFLRLSKLHYEFRFNWLYKSPNFSPNLRSRSNGEKELFLFIADFADFINIIKFY